MSCKVITEDGGSDELLQNSSDHRTCANCGQPISIERLNAIPWAHMCTVCTAMTGDVPQLRRHDEPTPDGTVSTYYKEGHARPLLMLQVRRGYKTKLEDLRNVNEDVWISERAA